MKKAFKFIESLKPSFYDLMGFPQLDVHSDFVDVCFRCRSIIRDLEIFDIVGYDELRFYADDGCILFVYTFYNDKD